MVARILSLSDVIVGFVYSPQISQVFPNIDLILGCGDLPNYYLDYAASVLNTPLYYVNGNHDLPTGTNGTKHNPESLGGVNIHRKVIYDQGVLLGGVEGCICYNDGPYQYTQAEMWGHIFSLMPILLLNRLVFGRYLDVFISHAPPWGINDRPDFPHQGIKAFRWFIKVFKPAYHFHGHIHVYRPDIPVYSKFIRTTVINSFGFSVNEVGLD